MDKNTYKIQKELCTLLKLDKKNQQNNKINVYFLKSKPPYFIVERIKFNDRMQGKSESIQQYVKESKSLSNNCKFGNKCTEQ